MTFTIEASKQLKIINSTLGNVNIYDIENASITNCRFNPTRPFNESFLKLSNSTCEIHNVTVEYLQYCNGTHITHNSHVLITGMTIRRNKAENALVILEDSSMLIIKDSQIDENLISTGGGVIFNSNATLEIENCTLRHNYVATNYGGSLYGEKKAILLVKSSTLENNNASFSGGAIYVENQVYLEISNSKFNHNEALFRGGAISAELNCTVVIVNTSFSFNTVSAKYGGALSVINYSTLNASRVKFVRNESPEGGAIYIETVFSAICTYCTLVKNTAHNHGGAISAINSVQLFMGNSQLSRNHALAGNGGGIYLKGIQGSLRLRDTYIKKNQASAEGGGIYLFGCNVVIDNSTVYGNSANSKGGAIYTSNSNLKITNVSIAKNSAANVGGEGGDIMAQTQCNLHMSDSQLYGNKGAYGALFASDDTNTTLNNVDFYKNFAANVGGAIGIESNSVLVATECRFSNNVAALTSIISAYDNSHLTLKKSTISDNICGRLHATRWVHLP